MNERTNELTNERYLTLGLWSGLGGSRVKLLTVRILHLSEPHITAQGPRLRNDLLYCVEWDVKP